MTVTEKSEISFTSGVCVCVCVCVCDVDNVSTYGRFVLFCPDLRTFVWRNIKKKLDMRIKMTNVRYAWSMVIASKQNRNARPSYLFNHHNQTPGFIMIDDYQKTQIILDFLPIFLRKFRAAL